MYHNPVLLKESIEGLRIRPDGTYVDATYGGGGHSRAILGQLVTGRLLAFDRDPAAGENALKDNRFIFIPHNFRYLGSYLKLYGVEEIDGLLADLGVSSHQFDNPDRGFSTRLKGTLDMRMDRDSSLSAKEVVNTYPEEDLTRIFSVYGEISQAGRLSKLICEERMSGVIERTDELAGICLQMAPRGRENKFLAQVFQALRIEVNEELDALKDFLSQSGKLLVDGGRLVVISYHSLEDRLTKNYIRWGNFDGIPEKDFYGNPKLIFRQINKKPIVPAEEEIEENSRARSAKLRIAEKVI